MLGGWVLYLFQYLLQWMIGAICRLISSHINLVCKLIEQIWVPGRALPEKWGRVCAALKTPFSHPPHRSQDPHFSIFQFSRPYFHPQITTQIPGSFKLQNLRISKEFSSTTSNWAKIQFIWLRLLRNSVH